MLGVPQGGSGACMAVHFLGGGHPGGTHGLLNRELGLHVGGKLSQSRLRRHVLLAMSPNAQLLEFHRPVASAQGFLLGFRLARETSFLRRDICRQLQKPRLARCQFVFALLQVQAACFGFFPILAGAQAFLRSLPQLLHDKHLLGVCLLLPRFQFLLTLADLEPLRLHAQLLLLQALHVLAHARLHGLLAADHGFVFGLDRVGELQKTRLTGRQFLLPRLETAHSSFAGRELLVLRPEAALLGFCMPGLSLNALNAILLRL
mmetsp:Transcript_71017/g.197270  ORF Transcript_71017/g.197270 Transcript_71017/m.197270 type:complete len:261 (-) Transcript_71017:1534-2316(-)